MTTLDDQASEREDQHREWAMTYRKQAGPLPSGACHYCDEPAPPGAQFCSTECRSDWSAEERAKIQNLGRNE